MRTNISWKTVICETIQQKSSGWDYPALQCCCVLQGHWGNAGRRPTASIHALQAPSHQVCTSSDAALQLFSPPFSDLYWSTFSHTALFIWDCCRESPTPSVCALPAWLPAALALSSDQMLGHGSNVG